MSDEEVELIIDDVFENARQAGWEAALSWTNEQRQQEMHRVSIESIELANARLRETCTAPLQLIEVKFNE